MTEVMRRRLSRWRLLFHQMSWADPSVGLAGGDVDIAVAWLPQPGGCEFCARVVAEEARWVALPSGHPLAGRDAVPFAELAAEPFVTLLPSAGPARDFWLGTEDRSTPARIAAEATTADETFDAVAAGLGVAVAGGWRRATPTSTTVATWCADR